jgi:glutamate formiminotransferase
VLECVPNVSEGRDPVVLDRLAAACGPALLDRHVDPDHHRSVFTLAGPGPDGAASAVRQLATAVVESLDLRRHQGVHPRLGALDVVPFVALDGRRDHAVDAARSFGEWLVGEFGIPVFFYGDASPTGRTLPAVRHDAFERIAPDLGPGAAPARLGATAVGARPPLVAINCWLVRDDLTLARRVARAVRERDGGLPGVRALGLRLTAAGAVQVSMNLVDLERTGVEAACSRVRDLAEAAGNGVARVELVGLLPVAVLAATTEAFRAWSGLTAADTIEARLGRGAETG